MCDHMCTCTYTYIIMCDAPPRQPPARYYIYIYTLYIYIFLNQPTQSTQPPNQQLLHKQTNNAGGLRRDGACAGTRGGGAGDPCGPRRQARDTVGGWIRVCVCVCVCVYVCVFMFGKKGGVVMVCSAHISTSTHTHTPTTTNPTNRNQPSFSSIFLPSFLSSFLV
jgi:hypothetical protein